MKQEDKKDTFQAGDVYIDGKYIGTTTSWKIIIKHTLRQKIGLWWHNLSATNKTCVVITAINAAVFTGWLTIFITR